MSRVVLLAVFVCICMALFQKADAFGEYCEESGIRFKKGETITVPGECISFTCEEPGVNLMLGKRCEKEKPSEGCKEDSGDDSKEFPDCCPKVIC